MHEGPRIERLKLAAERLSAILDEPPVGDIRCIELARQNLEEALMWATNSTSPVTDPHADRSGDT